MKNREMAFPFALIKSYLEDSCLFWRRDLLDLVRIKAIPISEYVETNLKKRIFKKKKDEGLWMKQRRCSFSKKWE